MSKIGYLVIVALTLFLVSCNNSGNHSQSTDSTSEVSNAQFKTFECEQFSISYPTGYYVRDETDDTGLSSLYIYRDSNDVDVTSITWEAPGTFPGNVKKFVSLITYKEIEDYKASDTFYDVMSMDSTYTINGYPTYSISSIFTEGNDTIIQSRTGLIIPDKLDMIIVQRVKTTESKDEVQKIADIFQSIKIKECSWVDSPNPLETRLMENINAVHINDGVPQVERLLKLNQIAIQQMQVLEGIVIGIFLSNPFSNRIRNC